MTQPMKNFLTGLSAANRASIDRALNSYAAKLRNSPVNEEDVEDGEDVISLRRVLRGPQLADRERTRLASFETWADQTYLPDLLDKLASQITDFASASNAVSALDIKFFATLPISNEGKQKLAASLLRMTRQYANNYNDFWQALVDGDNDTLDAVSFDIVSEENQQIGAA